MKKKNDNNPNINNIAIIQYLLKNGDMKILVLADYDVQKLKHRVSIHMTKKVMSIQFYYNVSTNKYLHILQNGVIIK